MFPPFAVKGWPKPNLTVFNQSKKTSEEWAEIRLNLSQPYDSAVEHVRIDITGYKKYTYIGLYIGFVHFLCFSLLSPNKEINPCSNSSNLIKHFVEINIKLKSFFPHLYIN